MESLMERHSILPKNKAIYLFLFILALSPLYLSAHGGVEKSVGNVTVFLSQDPISPLVGEEVRMTFVFANKQDVLERHPNLEVQLTLTDTFFGNASLDKIILEKTLTTNANGGIEFSYTFNKENFFDVDMVFTDPSTGLEENIGFLVQPRAEVNQLQSNDFWAGLMLGIVAMLLLFKFYIGKSGNA